MATIEAIATTYLEADAASVTFSSIPSTYEHLQLRISGRDDDTGAATGTMGMRFTSDSGNNYAIHYVAGDGASTTAGGVASRNNIQLYRLAGGSTQSTIYGSMAVDVLNYSDGVTYTTTRAITGMNGSDSETWFMSGLWMNTTAVNAIELVASADDLVRGSSFTLYGLKSS